MSDPIRPRTRPPTQPGSWATIGLVAGALVAAVFVALVLGILVGESVDSRSSLDTCADCFEDYSGILAGVNAFFVGVPVFAALFLFLMFRSRKRRIAEANADQLGEGPDLS